MERLSVYLMSIEFTPEEMDQMEQAVASFLNRQEITITTPVDIFRLATDLNFDVRAAMFPPKVQGLIMVDEHEKKLADFHSNKVIAYNALSDINDKKFIVAHELAHYISEKGKSHGADKKVVIAARDVEGDYSNNRDEQRMDYMAAALLMPREDILKRFDLGKADICETLANYYRVSPTLAQRRVKEVTLCQNPKEGRPL